MQIKYANFKPVKLLLLTLCSVMVTTGQAETDPLLLEAARLPLTAQANVDKPFTGLAAALRATMTHNPMIKGKQAELEAQQFGVSSAKAKRYPTLSTLGSNVNNNYDQATLRLDQPLWAFGKIDTEIARAESEVNAEQWRLLDIQRQLLEDTATVYAKIEGIKLRAEVAEINTEAHQSYYDRLARRQEGQLSSEADMRLAYARLLQAQTQLLSIKGELSDAQSELQNLTQILVSTELAVDPQLALLPSNVAVQRLAIDQEANILLKRQNLQVVKLGLKAEKLASLPTIYLRAEADLLDSTSGNKDLRAGLTFESSFEGLGLVARGRVKGAESRLAAARYDLDSSINDTRRRISSLMLNRQVQQGLIHAYQQTVNAMQETLDSFLRQYETGRKSWLELLNMQRELTASQMQLVQSKNDWLILSLRVASLTGGLDQQAGLNQNRLNEAEE
ncbi:outer membrane efflux protein [Psychromonas ingrahamii 37]|uniref:Outer membrane efflux protein n=1 Tax=Psychromonas ingrahamii (strain DSM 17664 / CCUG 51855 / 37) TaxID=357804 RepID=A1SYI6_PSYIN|nr:TolC family protein [Psychromonas ingrahamii]ABM04551.1 outer membrane efflux protein [Psychromonas ingrahamii 37]